MKKFALLALSVVCLLWTAGCETPAYTSQERGALIVRNIGFDYEQLQDDVDHLFLLRPATHLTEWNLQ